MPAKLLTFVVTSSVAAVAVVGVSVEAPPNVVAFVLFDVLFVVVCVTIVITTVAAAAAAPAAAAAVAGAVEASCDVPSVAADKISCLCGRGTGEGFLFIDAILVLIDGTLAAKMASVVVVGVGVGVVDW